MKQMKNETENEWSKTLGVCWEEKNPVAIQRLVELFYIHLTFPDYTQSLLSWRVCARPAQVGVSQCKFSS